MNVISAADPRCDQRQTLLLRTAKAVCTSGEYVCLVRNVSQGGVGLRFFHDVPPEERILLQLANGATYPIEQAWAGACDAGYRFAAEVDLAEFIEEPSPFAHRDIRLAVETPAMLTIDGRDEAVTLINVSRSGARLRADRHLTVGAFARLEVPGFALRFGHLCWRKGFDHGAVFQHALTLETLAWQCLMLNPLEARPGPGGQLRTCAA